MKNEKFLATQFPVVWAMMRGVDLDQRADEILAEVADQMLRSWSAKEILDGPRGNSRSWKRVNRKNQGNLLAG